MLVTVIALSALAVACTSSADDTGAVTTAAAATAPTSTIDGTREHEVESLGLTLRLPDAYVPVDGPDYAFAARRANPQSFLTISPDAPTVIDHEPEDGEQLTPVVIDGVDALIVLDPALDGLPDHVGAAELLVANGDRSFSAIMSAPKPELPGLWEAFVASVSIDAAG